jgi:endogenous inhibitor of DNA gyrase (YacG/DUF329 family)
VRRVPCPRCRTEVAWTPENRYRPFCSERCKTIDLGAWASGEYRLPVRDEDENATGETGQPLSDRD